MNKTTKITLTSLLLTTALAVPALAGPPQQAPGKRPGLSSHYKLFDVGTFGGEFSNFFGPATRQLNRHADAVGANNTALPDPFDPICFDNCLVDHAFEWKNGGTNDLGALFGSSVAIGINDKGTAAGLSQNGKFDDDTGIFELRAVAWKGGKIKNLGTLGGTQSSGGTGVNNLGQVAVQSSTADTNDPYINVPQANCIWLPTTGRDCKDLDFGINALFLPVTTTTHGAVWSKNAGLTDAGTLGGPDSMVVDINDKGQAVGWSYNSYDAGSSGVPDTRPFLWQNGTATDLGSFGGTFGEATMINQNGQVTGTSNLPGDTEVRPFIWDSGQMTDLGSLGGDYGHGDWINDQGDVVGFSRTTPGSIMGHAFYYHNGSMADLGVIGNDPESEANDINNNGIIVGEDFDRNVGDLRGIVSDNGGEPVDLNTLISKPHGLYVVAATQINDRGVIAANAITAKGEEHAVILVPENNLDMLARMDAMLKKGPHQNDSLPAVAPSKRSPAQQRCVAGRRLQPAVCRRG
jgi:probable HAF family extracellular repeat protein